MGKQVPPPPKKKIMNCAWKAFMHLKKERQLHHNSFVNEKIYICFELPPTMLRQMPWNLIKIRFLISSDKFAFSVYSDIEFVGADQRSDFNWDSSLHPPSRFQIMAVFIIGVLFTFTLKVLIFSEYLFHEVNSESGSLLDHRGDLNLNPSKICYTIFSFYISRWIKT